jgi:hypothetical protein
MKTLQTTAGVIGFILLADALFFMLWVLSGQLPVDNVYAGTITSHLLQLIIK